MKQRLTHILKILLGLFFIVSAILKIIGMDSFEIYVYSYGFFNLNFSFLVARAAIIIELVLGIGLVSNCFHKLMWWGSVLMLLCYTGLLTYALILGRHDNCHCMGTLVRMNPWQSIIKNIVLLALFALTYRVKGWRFKLDVLALVGTAVTCCVTVFAASPPDNWTPSYDPSYNLNHELFNEAMRQPPLDTLDLKKGKRVVGIFLAGCGHCKTTAKKLGLMQQFYDFPEEHVFFVFAGTDEEVERFFQETELNYPYIIYKDVYNLFMINKGVFPTVVLIDNGEIVGECGLRNMKEVEMKAFFENTNEP